MKTKSSPKKNSVPTKKIMIATVKSMIVRPPVIVRLVRQGLATMVTLVASRLRTEATLVLERAKPAHKHAKKAHGKHV